MSHERKSEALDAEAFRAIAEFTYDWESWIGPRGDLLWTNPAVERITGYRVEECLAMPDYPLGLVHTDDRELIAGECRAAEAGQSANHVEFRILRQDGSSRWGAISYQPIFDADGRSLGYRSSVRDIEERKQMEARLEKLVVEAERANRAKTEFLANVSHELRTPLQSLLSHAELIEREKSASRAREFAQAIMREGRHLDRLVRDLLDYSALAAGKLTILTGYYQPWEHFRPRLLALAKAARRKGLDFRFTLPPQGVGVRGDADRALQILTNLAQNAIQYSPAGEVSVRIALGPRSMTIEVRDQGPGLPAGINLLEPFRRGDSVGSTPGFGLGLAITSRLATHMGGELRAGPAPGGGALLCAEFEVTPDASERVEATTEGLGILVVDDVESVREALVLSLRSLGREALGVSDRDAALPILRARPNQVVLLDLNIPGSAAAENAALIRRELGPRGQLFAMSASPIARDQSELEAQGFDGFLLKPIARRRLEELLVGHSPSIFGGSAANAPAAAAVGGAVAGHSPSDLPSDLPIDLGGQSGRWDQGRLAELEAVRDAEGRPLSQRLCQRLEQELPRLIAALEVAASERRGPETREGMGSADTALERALAEAPTARERALHDLAGVAGLVGAVEAYDFLVREEERCRRGQSVDVPRVVRVVAEFLEEFRARVSR